MAASFSDQVMLAADGAFIARVRQALIACAIGIITEDVATAQHDKRVTLATQPIQVMPSIVSSVVVMSAP